MNMNPIRKISRNNLYTAAATIRIVSELNQSRGYQEETHDHLTGFGAYSSTYLHIYFYRHEKFGNNIL